MQGVKLKILLAACAACAAATAGAQTVRSLAELSLEELANIQITSVSLRPERLADAAASVYVITGEDIRRSGATSLPEALRLAPNLAVARVNRYDYAISTRAFTATRANKLLVMIDGRAAYSPLFSGVFWDAQDIPLEDIERIEVISGPGGVTWGSNAVIGVINVITRRAAATPGGFVSAGAGDRERGAVARYGGRIGSGHYRLYAKSFDRDGSTLSSGAPAADAWRKTQAGFRADWQEGAGAITLQGEAYDGSLEQSSPGRRSISGANLLARWSRSLGAGSELALQGYFDHTRRDHPGVFGETLDIAEVSLQHDFRPRPDHHVTWGLGYRHASDRVRNSAAVVFLPADKSMHWASAFAQDEVTLRPQLRLTLGARLENNPYSGTELMPSARLAWKPDAARLVWAAASRAVRSPSRIDRELALNTPFVPLLPNPRFRAETSDVLELGHRAQPSRDLSYSLTAFHHRHRHLRSLETLAGGSTTLDNRLAGTTTGVEAWGSLQASERWRLSAGTVLVRQRLRALPGSNSSLAGEGNDPSGRWMLRSAHDLGPGAELDLLLRHVGPLPDPQVPSYTALDARLGWRLSRDLDFSITAHNLLDRRHAEFGAAPRSEVERSVFVRLTWRR